MARRTERKSKGSSLGLFLLLNLIPIGVGIWVLVQWQRGELVIRDLPPGLTETLIGLGASLVALLMATSGLGVAHARCKDARRGRKRAAAMWRGEEPGGRLAAVGSWLGAVLLGLIAGLARIVFMPLSLALLALAIVFLVRLFQPEFARELIESLLTRIRPA